MEGDGSKHATWEEGWSERNSWREWECEEEEMGMVMEQAWKTTTSGGGNRLVAQ